MARKFKPFTALTKLGKRADMIVSIVALGFILVVIPLWQILSEGSPWYTIFVPTLLFVGVTVLSLLLVLLAAVFRDLVWAQRIKPWWDRQLEKENNK